MYLRACRSPSHIYTNTLPHVLMLSFHKDNKILILSLKSVTHNLPPTYACTTPGGGDSQNSFYSGCNSQHIPDHIEHTILVLTAVSCVCVCVLSLCVVPCRRRVCALARVCVPLSRLGSSRMDGISLGLRWRLGFHFFLVNISPFFIPKIFYTEASQTETPHTQTLRATLSPSCRPRNAARVSCAPLEPLSRRRPRPPP